MPDEMSEKVVCTLSAKECETVVRNALKLSPDESIKIASYTLEKGSNDLVGFMGEYFKLRVQIADEVCKMLFTKCISYKI